ncbi:hypothetical protein ACH4SP_23325 [Streptomyces sp. NPDC021093]|uniref:hypothetical protein n=1 Tax=Streptomyces sp. NPDC021093 TaxID=3365112 RepID=UPI0037A307BC
MARRQAQDDDAGTGAEQGAGAWRRREVNIGSVSDSAFAIGDHNDVRNEHHGRTTVAPRDEQQAELLRAVRNLRGDLARCTRTEPVDVLDAELAATEEDITGTGEAAPSRLARLRTALTTAEGVTAMLASGAAVGQAVGVLGG